MIQDIVNFLKVKKNQRTAFLLSLWVGIVLGAFCLRTILLPFVVAFTLAYVLNPIVTRLSKLRRGFMPRWAAVIVVYVILFAFFGILGTFFVPELYREAIRLAKEVTEIINAFDEAHIRSIAVDIGDFFRRYNLPVEIVAPTAALQDGLPAPVIRGAQANGNLLSIDLVQLSRHVLSDSLDYIKNEAASIVSRMSTIAVDLVEFIFMFFLVLVITAFLLIDIENIKAFMFNLVPLEDKGRFDRLIERIDIGLSGVVRGQLLICCINAILTLIGLLLLGIKFAFIMATMAGIFSLIPIFGSIISTVPIALVALSISPLTSLLSIAWIVGIHAIESHFLNPKILGKSAKIHPVIIVLSLLAGKEFYGVIGLMLAVPVASIAATIFRSILHRAKELEAGVAKGGKGGTLA